MTKVMVIGNAGGGKSTMSKTLSKAYRLPYHAIDRLQWRPGWTPTPEPYYNAAHDALLAGERWLIDGYGSWPSIERRLRAADTIIFVDHPLRIHYWWAGKRQLKSLFIGRPDGPEGCRMLPVTLRLFKMMWQLHRDARPRLIAAIEAQRGRAEIIYLRSPAALNRFTASLPN